MTADDSDELALDLSDVDFLENWDGVIPADLLARADAASMAEQRAEWDLEDEEHRRAAASQEEADVNQNQSEAPVEKVPADAEQIEQIEEDPYVDWEGEQKARDHAKRVEARLEYLRVDREARALHAVEVGAFGVFDPTDAIDIEDLNDLAATDYLVEKTLERSAMTMLFSDSYVGKTFLALDWALCVATGSDWLGRPVKRGRVLYVLMEGRASFKKRRRAWEAHRGLTLRPGSFIVYSKTVNLLDQTSVTSLATFVKKEQFAFVIFDTLSRGIAGADENSTEMMGRFISSISQVREAHEPSHVLVLHHSKKDDVEKYRGASVLFAAFDNVLCLRRAMLGDDPVSRADPRRRLIFQKVKSGQPEPDMNMVFEQVKGTDSAVLMRDVRAGMDPVATHLIDMQIGRTSNTGPITRAELKTSMVAAGLYTSEASANSRLSTLIRNGVLALNQTSSEISVA